MRSSSLLATAALAASLAGCASAGWHTYAYTPPPKPAVRVASAQDAKSVRTICRDTAPTGTLVPRKECHTPAQWDAIEAGQMDSLNLQAARSMPGSSSGH